MVRNQEQKERAQDQRLQRKYGITIADRRERERQQNHQCKLCGGPLDPPCVDHFHFKIEVNRATAGDVHPSTCLKWKACGYDEMGNIKCAQYSRTKAHAILIVRHIMMPDSIRGLLCRHCNRALGMLERFFDAARHPERVESALDYLRARLKNS